MKSIEELEKLEWEELEQAALQDPAPVPEGLQQRLSANLAAKSLAEEATVRKSPVRAFSYTALAAAAALAAVLVLPRLGNREPKDTFDDPYLAYAEVEKVFQSISDKMATGVDIAREAKPVAEKTLNVLEKINIQ
ncbi:MAG: hypothetical protein II851_08680 [Bacteroidales bacterium]|nr:hypothetical protein [Bacteroidales bacterium]